MKINKHSNRSMRHLIESLRKKCEQINPASVAVESIFHSGGTVTEEEAQVWMDRVRALHDQWDAVTLEKCFEEEVIRKATGEREYILFNVRIKDDFTFIAEHEALTREQEESGKIAFRQWHIDTAFSLDNHLQALHELCLNAIIESEFFRLA